MEDLTIRDIIRDLLVVTSPEAAVKIAEERLICHPRFPKLHSAFIAMRGVVSEHLRYSPRVSPAEEAAVEAVATSFDLTEKETALVWCLVAAIGTCATGSYGPRTKKYTTSEHVALAASTSFLQAIEMNAALILDTADRRIAQ